MKDMIEHLTRKIKQLTIRNRELEERVHRLESPSISRSTRGTRNFRRGDRVKVVRPTCPGANRAIIPTDGTATVTRTRGPWVCALTDSGIEIQICPKCLELIEAARE